MGGQSQTRALQHPGQLCRPRADRHQWVMDDSWAKLLKINHKEIERYQIAAIQNGQAGGMRILQQFPPMVGVRLINLRHLEFTSGFPADIRRDAIASAHVLPANINQHRRSVERAQRMGQCEKNYICQR